MMYALPAGNNRLVRLLVEFHFRTLLERHAQGALLTLEIAYQAMPSFVFEERP